MNIILGSNTVRLIGSPVEHMGRVEVYDRRSNQWGTICTNDVLQYEYSLGQIICKSLGYSSYIAAGRANTSSNIRLSSNNPIVTRPIRCTYTSSYLYQNLYQCSEFESHLGISPSRCTSDEEWVVVCDCKFSIVLCMYVYQESFKGSIALKSN